MATTYKATITIKCWKQHECVGCGGAYRYKFQRSVTGQGGNESAAERAAEQAAMRAMEREVDQRPCPRCGCLQPDMIAQGKSRTHRWLALILLALSAAVVAFGLISSATLVTYAIAGLILVVMSALALPIHAAVALSNPNKNKDANRNRAAKAVDTGLVEEVADEDLDLADGEPRAVGRGVLLLLILGVVGTLFTVAPFALKAVSGWPTVEGTKPEVLSPGDSVTVWFPDRIQAVKGLWSGSPRVTVVNDGGAGPLNISATASRDNWGNTISGKSVSNSSPNLWAELKVPDNAALAGKTIEVRVDMDLNYPTAIGNTFDNVTGKVTGTKKLTFAAAGASGTYRLSFWLAILGAVLVAVCGFGLAASAGALRKLAAPATVEQFEKDGGRRRRDDDEDEDDRPRRRRADDDEDRPRRRRDDDEDDRRSRSARDDDDDRRDRRDRRRRDDDDDDYDDRPRRRR